MVSRTVRRIKDILVEETEQVHVWTTIVFDDRVGSFLRHRHGANQFAMKGGQKLNFLKIRNIRYFRVIKYTVLLIILPPVIFPGERIRSFLRHRSRWNPD